MLCFFVVDDDFPEGGRLNDDDPNDVVFLRPVKEGLRGNVTCGDDDAFCVDDTIDCRSQIQ